LFTYLVTFESNNQQTVDYSEKLSNNQNSPIVSEIYNTNIETGDGGSNPTTNPGPQASNPIEQYFRISQLLTNNISKQVKTLEMSYRMT
jgi:hypothetical protein